jgi:hypothetical protein
VAGVVIALAAGAELLQMGESAYFSVRKFVRDWRAAMVAERVRKLKEDLERPDTDEAGAAGAHTTSFSGVGTTGGVHQRLSTKVAAPVPFSR